MTTVEILLRDGRRMSVTCATVEDAVRLADSIDPLMLPWRTIMLVPLPAEEVTATATIQDLAREAMQVQDACNLDEVVHGFSRAVASLREILRATGGDLSTAAVNQHPVCCLWASKIHDLARMGPDDRYGFDPKTQAAWNACEEILVCEEIAD